MMHLKTIFAPFLLGLLALGGAGAAQASLSYTLSSCESYTCTTPLTTILSFTTDAPLAAPPLPASSGFSAYVPISGATAIVGSFTGIEMASYNADTHFGSYLRVDGLVSADGSGIYSINGLPATFAAPNGPYRDLPLTIGVGTYNLGSYPCLDADCRASAGGFRPTLLTVIDTAAVPEPAAWVLMIFGFGAIGLTKRRNPGQRFAR